jgi:hypothetical protein
MPWRTLPAARRLHSLRSRAILSAPVTSSGFHRLAGPFMGLGAHRARRRPPLFSLSLVATRRSRLGKPLGSLLEGDAAAAAAIVVVIARARLSHSRFFTGGNPASFRLVCCLHAAPAHAAPVHPPPVGALHGTDIFVGSCTRPAVAAARAVAA